MHDYLLSMANDHVDERIKDDITDFVVKTHNRHQFEDIPFPVYNTFITESQTSAMVRTEHSFSTVKINLSTNIKKISQERKPSADVFLKKPPLGRDDFESLIFESFSAHTIDGRINYPYPSGGGLYSGQVVVFTKNVEGYETGAYHYLPLSNLFEKLDNLSETLVDSALFMKGEKNFKDYDFFILYGSIIDKHICRYGHRGYRLAVLEIGSMYRNLEIQAQLRQLRNRVWGGFRDEALSVTLGIDPRVVMPVVCQIIGR